ncbi:MAG: hypothetical protein KatS3mg119_0542 [Rhodothalassiaceae bacterium]|nr:MAG: hypothetical protein KatS3mg119_0542 [Rhodothalassiaceae bacterium]
MAVGRDERETAHWTRYWRAPRLASCGPLDSAYAGPIGAHWEGIFARALRKGDRLLDLCAGNGAIAVLAARTALRHRRPVRIDAIDRAAIDPLRHLRLEKPVARQIRFHPRTDAAALPFRDGSFDWVVSQFGIEYAPRPAAVAEAVRVARPGARLHFVMHAAEGVLARAAAREKAEAEALRAAPLPARTREVLARLKAGTDTAAAGLLIAGLKREADRLLKSLGAPANPGMVRHCVSLCLHTVSVAGHFPLRTLIEKIDELEAELDAHARRLGDLLAAAVAREDLASWAADLARFGATEVKTDALRAGPGEDLVAWIIDARRAG